MSARYAVNKPILAIGLFIENEKDVRFLPNLEVYCLVKQMDEALDNSQPWNVDDFGFKIIQIIPECEHQVDMLYSENKGLGYTGISPDLNRVFTSDPVLHNQYPSASCSQTSNEDNWHWKLHFEETSEGVIDLLKENKTPYYYQGIEQFLNTIQYSIKSNKGNSVLIENLKKIYQDVLDELTKNFDAWDVKHSTCEFLEYQKTTVTMKEGLVNGEGCSVGPVRSLPGESSTIHSNVICDEHPNRLSVKRIQGETDSFGCEYLHMCQECYDGHKKYEEEHKDDEEECEWCHGINKLRPYRDPEEGLAGRVYRICDDCLDNHREYLRAYDE